MATMPHIIDSYPAPDSTGIAIGDSVQVTFDQEMDESSINSGTLVLIAPTNDLVFGPGLEPFEQQDSSGAEDILDTPPFSGYIQGTITFSKVDSNGDPVDDSEVDYDGEGDLWRTVATLTPSQPLRPNVEYTVIVGGDEDQTNDFKSGVKTRSVFDAEEVAVSGTGTVEFLGTYTGTASRTYILEVITGGATGTATYQWWNEATPLDVHEGVTTTGYRTLENGVQVTFGADGTFVVGDQWQVVTIPALLLANNYSWIFTTGSGSIVEPVSTYSASGINDLPTASSASASGLYVSDIDPDEGEYGVVISTDAYAGNVITITFSAILDTDTISNDVINVYSESPNGDESIATVTGTLDYTAVVSTNTLTITLDPGQLYENNIVIVKLDKTIADTDGNTLTEDYISYFATTYTPLYSSIRRIQLEIGSYLPPDIKDETIYLAILIASLQADAFSYVTTMGNIKLYNLARQEYTTCLASRMLLTGSGLNSSRLSKRLADLSISRDGNNDDLRDELASCMSYWELPLKSGGNVDPDASLSPQYSIKGIWSDDYTIVGRGWEPTVRLGAYRSAANTKTYRTSRRKWNTHRTRYNRSGS